MTQASLFPEYKPANKYVGTLLYGPNEQRFQCECAETAILNDNVDMIKECIAAGWLSPEHRTFMNDSIIHRCDYLGRVKVAAHLRSLGWPE